MKHTLAETIVQFLSFSGNRCDHFRAAEQFSPRPWERVPQWLADAGLAFYFLQKLKRHPYLRRDPPISIESFAVQPAQGRRPVHWDVRELLIRQQLNSFEDQVSEAGCLRQILQEFDNFETNAGLAVDNFSAHSPTSIIIGSVLTCHAPDQAIGPFRRQSDSRSDSVDRN